MLRVSLNPLCYLCLLGLTAAAPDAASKTAAIDVTGRVTSGGGLPLEHARVTFVASGEEVFTDARGRFTAGGCTVPCELRIHHPRFVDRTLAVDGSAGEPLEIALEAKQELFDNIEVTASRGTGGALAPASAASTVVRTEEEIVPPTTLLDLVEGVAGVAENGQGGIFQVFSIRGVSRHRVLTLVSGMRITGERRAGVSTSFIDPTLMGSVDVVRGPASTYYGSGALGGVVQVFPRVFDRIHFDTGYDSFGDQSYTRVGWGGTDERGGRWSVGLAHRTMDNDEAAEGTELNAHFTQTSASIARRWGSGRLNYEILALPSYGDDLGKSNTDFPRRITNYPRERHLLLRFGVSSEGRGDGAGPWDFYAFAHPNDLITEVLRAGESFTVVDNESFDLGAGWQREWVRSGGRSGGISGRYGVDYVGRRSVSSTELAEDLVDGSAFELNTLSAAGEDEGAAFASIRWGAGEGSFQAGGRFTWQRQENGDLASRDDSAVTAFLGYVRPLGAGFELTANIGTGLRFPNLSERFFTGTTGRGGVIGNPDLDSETSFTTDVGVRWYGDQTFFSAQVYSQRIDDYIERIELEDDLLTFENLTSGTIDGVEVEGFHELTDRWHLSWSGHLIDGEDSDDTPLADIPANRVQAGIRYRLDAWDAELLFQRRASKNDPGSGEISIPSADLVSASVSYRITSDLALTLSGRNLFDEVYFNSADDKSPIAPGRSVGLGISWSRP